jgi:hypothetical protein
MEVGQGPNWGCSIKEKKNSSYSLCNVVMLTTINWLTLEKRTEAVRNAQRFQSESLKE